VTAADTSPPSRAPAFGRAGIALAALGRFSRGRIAFALAVCALAFGVLREAPLASSWRRPVRAEFRRALRQAVAGGLLTTMVAAALVGIAMINQALLWLDEVGQERLIGSILIAVLIREVAPVIVGLIVLGRSGMAAAAESGGLQLRGQIHMLTAQGIDPFLIVVLPRALALALGSYTLGVVFVIAAMGIGVIVGNLAGGVAMSFWEFFATVLGAMEPADFIIFPAKMLVIGLLVALTSTLTGLTAQPGDDAGALLPRAFVRGTLAIMLVTVALSLAL
jgi:phospholipid/cholesterol/gamma-HCH transport system permease protein